MANEPLHRPFLEGEKVILRGLLEEDLNGNYSAWFNDQEVCRANNHGRFPMSLPELRDFYERQKKSKTELVLAIVVKESKEHIGNISLQGIRWVDRCAEYAIVVGEKSAWGKGYATEASDLIIKHGFHELNLNRIQLGTLADNEGMKKLAKHMGMIEEGRRRELVFKHGKFVDQIEYAILRSEYLSGKKTT